MKAINILFWVGVAVFVPLLIWSFGEEFVLNGLSYGFAYALGMLIGLVLWCIILIKMTHLILIKKRDKEIEEILKRLKKLEE